MTKEMAIKILRGGVLGTDELTHEAVFMAIKALKEQERVDAEPVRHGHWELSPFDGNWTCSECGNKPYHSNMEDMNYCPKCGTKMEVKKR